jgi:hypothetical protein
MSVKNKKSSSSSSRNGSSLTIYDAPNACRELMALADQVVAAKTLEEAQALGQKMGPKAKLMLDAIVASIDQLMLLPAPGQPAAEPVERAG